METPTQDEAMALEEKVLPPNSAELGARAQDKREDCPSKVTQPKKEHLPGGLRQPGYGPCTFPGILLLLKQVLMHAEQNLRTHKGSLPQKEAA